MTPPFLALFTSFNANRGNEPGAGPGIRLKAFNLDI